MRSSARVQTRQSGYACRWCCATADDLPGVTPGQTYQTPARPGTRHRKQGRGKKPDASRRVPCGIVHSLLCSPQDVVCVLTIHASRYGVGHATDALSAASGALECAIYRCKRALLRVVL